MERGQKMEIKGTVSVVTGGASGLGEATVRELVAQGGKVAILDLTEDRGLAIAKELGESARFFKTDVTDENSVRNAVDGTVNALGALDVAVNCAGVGTPAKVLGKEGPMDMAQFNKVVQINLMGTVNVIRLAAEQMVKNPGNADGEKGVVINTASVAAFEGQIGQAAYSASKAGVVGMTLPIAREFADYGIRVVTIAPGLFLTPMLQGLPENVQESLAQMVPFPKRLGKPTEYAMLARHIIENPVLNGEVIRLDSSLRMAAK
jgi:NAD(P)-dependent dehydrogenase (short-subunit alcohol dehydrogenase family)